METKILVAYASKYGSTQEVAEVIALTLGESGSEVELQPMRKVRALIEYGAVVLGAPLYGGWHKDMQHFLALHHEALTQRPAAIYSLGPLSMDEKEWKAVRSQLDQELSKYGWLKPVALELFGGRFDPAKLRFPDSFIAGLPASPLHGQPARDLRDWTAIRLWARNLAVQLQPVLS